MDSSFDQNFVFLANCREDKGFNFLVDVAERLPTVRFIALANQSDPAEAQAYVDQRGLENVRVCGKTDSIGEYYSKAAIVAVPSYKFVETFSRVCIEAQRFGKPVIGCDVGNVPLLLRESGIILEQDVSAWVETISKLLSDEAYYAKRVQSALENSAKYSRRSQLKSMDAVIDRSRSGILIGVGSGIGNMLHAGPMIRNIALKRGRQVDLVVAEDHSRSLFLLQNDKYVNSVYSLASGILNRYYETVFLTHSFGGTRLPFLGSNVIWSRDWDVFRPGVSEHETVFNLMAAKELLGISFEEGDTTKHYIGNFTYRWSDNRRVGIHGGSKGGYWGAKRWGFYGDLSRKLQGRGFEVASFGTEDEYIEGTVNATGGSISEMVEGMRSCSYFVSNDSGLMNIANALGIPLISLFAPTEARTRKPLGPRSRVIKVEADCSPCEVVNPTMFRDGMCRCIDRISVDVVLHEFDKLVEDIATLISVRAAG